MISFTFGIAWNPKHWRCSAFWWPCCTRHHHGWIEFGPLYMDLTIDL